MTNYYLQRLHLDFVAKLTAIYSYGTGWESLNGTMPPLDKSMMASIFSFGKGLVVGSAERGIVLTSFECSAEVGGSEVGGYYGVIECRIGTESHGATIVFHSPTRVVVTADAIGQNAEDDELVTWDGVPPTPDEILDVFDPKTSPAKA